MTFDQQMTLEQYGNEALASILLFFLLYLSVEFVAYVMTNTLKASRWTVSQYQKVLYCICVVGYSIGAMNSLILTLRKLVHEPDDGLLWATHLGLLTGQVLFLTFCAFIMYYLGYAVNVISEKLCRKANDMEKEDI